MEHATFAVKTTVTDRELGQFDALAAAYTVDAGNEQIARGAFKKTISGWRGRNRQVPLHWDHQGEAENVIGTVDPMSLKEVDKGLLVSAQLDLEESSVAREAWRLVKRGAVALSFGYLVEADHVRNDGVKVLDEVSLYEISLTPWPMNADTEILSWKSATGGLSVDDLTDEELRERSLAAAAEAVAGTVSKRPMTEADEALVERAHAEYKAARAAEAAAKAEEDARRRRLVNLPQRRTTIVLTAEGYKELPPDAELATPEQIAEHEERRLTEEAEIREIEEARAKAAEEEPRTVSVCGMEVARVTVNGVPVFGEEL